MASYQFRLRTRSEPLSVSDYRALARRALPEMVWTYIDGGAEDLTSLQANRHAFRNWSLLPHVLTGAEPTALTTEVAGVQLSLPVLLAPTGMSGLAHWTGEVGGAQAAERCGTRAVVSTAASYTPEEIGDNTNADHFFQLYPWMRVGGESRALTQSIIERVEAAGYAALFLTVDSPILGNREGERRKGMGAPPTLTPRRILDAAVRPRWWINLVRHQRIGARLLVNEGGLAAGVESAQLQYRLMRPELNWDDFSWIRSQWRRPLFVKGILSADDAARAIDLGADGIVVSNHGGRQLDGVQATLDALPPIVQRVGDRAPVLLDGGIRRGSDVVKALCLGARAVMIGRPWLYGLAAAGPPGVEHVLGILREEILRVLTLMGVDNLGDLNRFKLVRD
jgi:isopentenyl diphosphate isomerase/L-lactate dehydrogenase-like FMN-dependent dehydrogenase